MNEQEIAEAIKIIREPITVHNEMYHYFDQENYDKLQQVYDNCQWFINNWEQLEQNYKDVTNQLKIKNLILKALHKYFTEHEHYEEDEILRELESCTDKDIIWLKRMAGDDNE